MTGAEVAFHLNAKRVGRGKWVAKCPHHNDRNASLSITEGKKGVLLTCWSQRCDTRDIVAAAGLTMSQLFYDSGRTMDRAARTEWQRRSAMEARYESLLKQLPLAFWMMVLERDKRRYWIAAQRRIVNEMKPMGWLLSHERFVSECYTPMMVRWVEAHPAEAEAMAATRVSETLRKRDGQ